MWSISLILFYSCENNERNDEPLTENLTIAEEILLLVNDHRLSEGLAILEANEAAQREAVIHTRNMAQGKVDFGHDGSDERGDLLFDETGAIRFGENVAVGQITAEEVMQSWLDSPGHRSNIEGDFTHLGVGVVEDSEGTPYYTQIFLKIN